MRCLIADDEPLARAKSAKYFREAGCDVVSEQADGESVLRWLEANPGGADALILDIQMPRMTGVEVAAALGESIPIVFVTGYREFAVSAYELGAVDYLEKPLSVEKVKRVVDRLQSLGMPGPSEG